MGNLKLLLMWGMFYCWNLRNLPLLLSGKAPARVKHVLFWSTNRKPAVIAYWNAYQERCLPIFLFQCTHYHQVCRLLTFLEKSALRPLHIPIGPALDSARLSQSSLSISRPVLKHSGGHSAERPLFFILTEIMIFLFWDGMIFLRTFLRTQNRSRRLFWTWDFSAFGRDISWSLHTVIP